MHAYLFVGQGITNFQLAISNLADKLKAKVLEFPLLKIEDVRNLNNLIRLSFDTPTLIVCPHIEEAGEEALNALLKNLEEPQQNIYFALTSSSVIKVLPTISSRCQIIKVQGTEYKVQSTEIGEFLEMTPGEKFSYIDKIRDRNQAIEFAENMVNFMHGSLHENGLKYNITGRRIELALQTLTRLKANGNVNLQLSNFVVNY